MNVTSAPGGQFTQMGNRFSVGGQALTPFGKTPYAPGAHPPIAPKQKPSMPQQQPNQPAPAQQQPPPNNPPPPITPETLSALNKWNKAYSMLGDKVSSFNMTDDMEMFAAGFFDKLSSLRMGHDRALAVCSAASDRSPAMAMLLAGFIKKAATPDSESDIPSSAVIGYKVDRPKTKTDKMILANQLWRRRKKRTDHEKTASSSLSKVLSALTPVVGAGLGAGGTYVTVPEDTSPETKRLLYGKNMFLGGTGAGIWRWSKDPSLTRAERLAAKGMLGVEGVTAVVTNPSIIKGDALTRGYKQLADSLDSALNQIDAQRKEDQGIRAADLKAREEEIKMYQERQKTEQASRQGDAAWKVGTGIGIAGLGAYGIYSILQNIKDRKNRDTRRRGSIKLTLPNSQDGRGVAVDVPVDSLPEYMHRQLMGDIRRDLRQGLEKRRGARRMAVVPNRKQLLSDSTMSSTEKAEMLADMA
jgi:hypothetical protein